MNDSKENFDPVENLRKARALQAAKVQPVCRTCHSPKIERRLFQTWSTTINEWETEELDTDFYCGLCEVAGREVIEEKDCGQYSIEEQEFMDRYKPRPNLKESPDGSYYNFERADVWGPDKKLWPHIKPNQVWTIVEDGDIGNEYVTAGSHWVNRMGYVITEEEWVTGSEQCLWFDRNDMDNEENDSE